MKTMVQAIRDFILTCPFIGELEPVRVEYLDNEADCFSIDPVPSDPLVKSYLNGSSYRQFTFMLSSREPYGPDVLQNLENSGFYERFARWLEEQSGNKQFPELEDFQQPVRIRAVNWGYAFQTEIDTAQYQIQCRFEYIEKAKG